MNPPVQAVTSLAAGRRPPVAARAGEPTPAIVPEDAITGRVVTAWALSWALLGSVVALGIAASTDASADLLDLARVSILFAEVIGFTALTSARLVFPLLTRLPLYVRLGLQVMTLLSGTVFGSLAIALTQPLFSLAEFRTIGAIVAVNAGIAVVVGLSLHTYDSMRREIESSYEKLREKEKLERDIAIARDVQRELLPRGAPRLPGIELAGVCLPAVGVGGDYYDFLPFEGGKVGLAVADVSGKGIPAALLMAGLQASVRTLAPSGLPPCEVVSRLNEILYESTSDSRYATLFLGVLALERRVLTYSNAGHYPPLHVAGPGAVRLGSGGPPIGLFRDSVYGEGTRELGAGDLLVLYTDGIAEAPGPGDEEFGDERLLRLLEGHQNHDLETLVRDVVDEVHRWSGDGARHDDITLVLARIG